MKVSVFFVLTVALVTAGSHSIAQQKADSTGMPGDNLNLHAVLDEFRKSKNLETFEKNINDPDKKINNLDLNRDGKTDYIRVIDHVDKNKEAHAIVLQVPVNAKESQDVAVIEVQKEGNENARIQIVGDRDVYGENYVVEPYENYVSKDEWDRQHNDDDVYNNTPATDVDDNRPVVVNVWTWPCVTYIYSPFYDPWYSPWYWGYYPSWWYPWQPYPWHVYYRHVWYHRGPAYYSYYYHRAPVHRLPAAHAVYQHRRTTSASYRRTVPSNIKSRPAQNPRVREKKIPDTYNNRRVDPGVQPQRKTDAPRQNRKVSPEVKPRPKVNPPRQNRRINPDVRPRPKVNPPRQNRPRLSPNIQPRQHVPGRTRQPSGGGRQR